MTVKGTQGICLRLWLPPEVVEQCNAAMKAAGTLEIDGIPECQTPDIPPVPIK